MNTDNENEYENCADTVLYNAIIKQGHTKPHEALEREFYDALESGANPNGIVKEFTLLGWAMSWNNQSALRELIWRGADLTIRDKTGDGYASARSWGNSAELLAVIQAAIETLETQSIQEFKDAYQRLNVSEAE